MNNYIALKKRVKSPLFDQTYKKDLRAENETPTIKLPRYIFISTKKDYSYLNAKLQEIITSCERNLYLPSNKD